MPNSDAEDADTLARRLSHLTGESVAEAVITALRERLIREETRRKAEEDLPERVSAYALRLRAEYDTRPVSQAEWDAACDDLR